MNGSHHRSSHSEHQSDTRCDHKKRCSDIYCRQRVTANSFSYKYPVRNNEQSREYHPKYRRN